MWGPGYSQSPNFLYLIISVPSLSSPRLTYFDILNRAELKLKKEF